jgi:hypothetical protein
MRDLMKLTIAMIMALPFLTVNAQTTPEAIIGQTPYFPSAQTLAISTDDRGQLLPEIRDFRDKIALLRSKILERETKDAESYAEQINVSKLEDEASANVKAQTGYSLDQLKNMSENDLQAMAQNIMNQKMAAGQTQVKNAAAQMGMSQAELMSMQNMSEKEMAAMVNDPARKAKRAEWAAENPGQVAKQQRQAAKNNAAYKNAAKATEAAQKFNEQMAYYDNLHQKEIAETIELMRGVYAQHASDMEAADRMTAECDGKTDKSNEWCQEAFRKAREAYLSREADCYQLWINQLSKIQGRYKTLLTDAQQLDALAAEVSDAQNANYAQQYGSYTAEVMKNTSIKGTYSALVASRYLDITESVLALPQIEE